MLIKTSITTITHTIALLIVDYMLSVIAHYHKATVDIFTAMVEYVLVGTTTVPQYRAIALKSDLRLEL